ncbi:MAG: cation acetate symporter [Actinomycetota bacterium]
MIPTLAVLGVTLATLVLGTAGLRYARTTSNFFVASRAVHPAWNAFAVCGEAMSAASYLGVPALVLVFGVDMLWTIVGWTLGFLLLSLFIAAPVRRFGSYTIPEFVEGRLDAPRLRPLVAITVIVSSWFFLLAQLKGAGVVTRSLLGTPYWVGVVAVGVLVAANLSAGGMRGITFVQGFQFFFIFLGILVPFSVLSALWWSDDDRDPIITDSTPVFLEATTATYPRTVEIDVIGPTAAVVDGVVDGVAVDGPFAFEAGRHRIGAATTIDWPEGAAVPHREGIEPLTGEEWAAPLGPKGLGSGHPLYFTYATVLASMFGIIALPHIVVRFYTNPTGRQARRTSLWVLAMIAPYYVMLPLFSALGRNLAPDLLSTGATDAATVVVPERAVDGLAAELLSAVVSAGATAAFLSTSSGLLIAMAGALSHDILSAGIPQFRRSVWLAAAVSIAAGLFVETIDINVLIGWSTSIAASSIGPLLVLGIWWSGLTRRGALATVVIGGTVTTGAVLITMFGLVDSGWPRAILSTPAAWSVPLAFAIGIVVSLLDREKVEQVAHKMALLHVPERSDAPKELV